MKGATGAASPKETKSKDMTDGGRRSMLTCPGNKSGSKGEVKDKITDNIHGSFLLSTLQVSHLMFTNYLLGKFYFYHIPQLREKKHRILNNMPKFAQQVVEETDFEPGFVNSLLCLTEEKRLLIKSHRRCEGAGTQITIYPKRKMALDPKERT